MSKTRIQGPHLPKHKRRCLGDVPHQTYLEFDMKHLSIGFYRLPSWHHQPPSSPTASPSPMSQSSPRFPWSPQTPLESRCQFFLRFYWISVGPTICLRCLSLSWSVICYDDTKIHVAVEVFCVPYTLRVTIKVAGGWWEVWQRYSPPSVTATSDIRRFQFWGNILY